MRNRLGRLLVAACLFASPCSRLVGAPKETWSLTRAYVSPEISDPPKVDGLLDDLCWDESEPATGFVLLVSSSSGGPPGVRTTAMTCWNRDGLYVGFECEEPLLHLVPPGEPRKRDFDVYNGEMVGLLLDVGNNRTEHYDLEIAAGLDGTLYDFGWGLKEGWDGQWSCAVRRWDKANVWCAELFVPWEDTREVPGRGDVWALQILRWRNVAGKEEAFLWSNLPEGSSHSMWEAPAFGHLFFGSTGKRLSRQLRALEKRYRQWEGFLPEANDLSPGIASLKRLAEKEETLSGTEWSEAFQSLHALSDRGEELYWRGRIDLLLRRQADLK